MTMQMDAEYYKDDYPENEFGSTKEGASNQGAVISMECCSFSLLQPAEVTLPICAILAVEWVVAARDVPQRSEICNKRKLYDPEYDHPNIKREEGPHVVSLWCCGGCHEHVDNDSEGAKADNEGVYENIVGDE